MNYNKIMKKTSRILHALFVLSILGLVVFTHSCANTTTPPTGGPKDTIPPLMVDLYPELGQTNVPTKKPKLEIKFNEYVVVKDPKSLYLSPPLEKSAQFKIKGKSVVVFFENDLNIAESARNTFMHRNTFLKRVERIIELTGIDIRKFENAMCFKFLMIVYNLTN